MSTMIVVHYNSDCLMEYTGKPEKWEQPDKEKICLSLRSSQISLT